jgi:hypothetical protein
MTNLNESTQVNKLVEVVVSLIMSAFIDESVSEYVDNVINSSLVKLEKLNMSKKAIKMYINFAINEAQKYIEDLEELDFIERSKVFEMSDKELESIIEDTELEDDLPF